MALLTPAYRLTFRAPGGAPGALGGAGKVLDSTTRPQASTMTGLSVELGMTGAADRVAVVMGQVGSFRPAVGEELQVELGYADDGGLSQVTRSTVVEADPDLVNRRIMAHGPAASLLRTRVDKTFEGSTAGAIVKDLATAAGVDVAKADAGITFPAYVVDSHRNAYQHIGDLAELCGFDRYLDNEGKLVFAFFTGGRTAHVFEFGRHILEIELQRRPVAASKVEAWGASPGAGHGQNSWAWFAKDFQPFVGSAGSGAGKARLLVRPALRTGGATRQAAQALLTELTRRAVQGRLLVTGSPQVRLGDSLHVSGVPEDGVDGVYQVRTVAHDLTKVGGFTTRIGFRSIEQAGALAS
jgi:hypothetical protein